MTSETTRRPPWGESIRIALLLAFGFLLGSMIVLWRSIRRSRLREREDPLREATPDELRSILAEVSRWREESTGQRSAGGEAYFELPHDGQPSDAEDRSDHETQVVRGALEEIAEHLHARLAGAEGLPPARIRSKLRVLLWNVRREREERDEEWD